MKSYSGLHGLALCTNACFSCTFCKVSCTYFVPDVLDLFGSCAVREDLAQSGRSRKLIEGRAQTRMFIGFGVLPSFTRR